MKTKRIRIHKRAEDQLRDIDYWDKLTPEQRSWLYKFLLEYGQGEGLKDNPIHPQKYHKELINNAYVYRSQIHNVPLEKVKQSHLEAMSKTKPNVAAKYYNLNDYTKDYENEKFTNDFDSEVESDSGEVLPGSEESFRFDETDE